MKYCRCLEAELIGEQSMLSVHGSLCKSFTAFGIEGFAVLDEQCV